MKAKPVKLSRRYLFGGVAFFVFLLFGMIALDTFFDEYDLTFQFPISFHAPVRIEPRRYEIISPIPKAEREPLREEKPDAIKGPISRTIDRYVRTLGANRNMLVNIAYAFEDEAVDALRVAECESKFDQEAVGSYGEIGIFQFLGSTFYAYGGKDINDWRDQVRVASRMWKKGQHRQWTCWRMLRAGGSLDN